MPSCARSCAVFCAQMKQQEARGNKDVRETPWLPLEAALAGVDMQPVAELRGDAAAGNGAGGGNGSSRGRGKGSSKAPAAILPQGSVRRVGFSAAGMGMKVVGRLPCLQLNRGIGIKFSSLSC